MHAHTQTKINEEYLRENGTEHKPRRSSINVTGALEGNQRRQTEEREKRLTQDHFLEINKT